MNIRPASAQNGHVYPNFVSIWSIEDQVSRLVSELNNSLQTHGESLRPILDSALNLRNKVLQKVMNAHVSAVQSRELKEFQDEYNSIRMDYHAITNPGSSEYFQISSDMEPLSRSSRSTTSRSSESTGEE